MKLIKLLALLTLPLVLTGCANVGNAIGAGFSTITVLADATVAACGNTIPGGPCAAGSVVSTEDRDVIRTNLFSADRVLGEAALALHAGREAEAAGKLEVALSLLGVAEQILIERQGEAP